MSVNLNTSNFFSEYILNPSSEKLNSTDRVIAWIATIALGVVTLGLAQLTAYALRDRASPKLPPGSTEVNNVAQNNMPFTPKSSSSSSSLSSSSSSSNSSLSSSSRAQALESFSSSSSSSSSASSPGAPIVDASLRLEEQQVFERIHLVLQRYESQYLESFGQLMESSNSPDKIKALLAGLLETESKSNVKILSNYYEKTLERKLDLETQRKQHFKDGYQASGQTANWNETIDELDKILKQEKMPKELVFDVSGDVYNNKTDVKVKFFCEKGKCKIIVSSHARPYQYWVKPQAAETTLLEGYLKMSNQKAYSPSSTTSASSPTTSASSPTIAASSPTIAASGSSASSSSPSSASASMPGQSSSSASTLGQASSSSTTPTSSLSLREQLRRDQELKDQQRVKEQQELEQQQKEKWEGNYPIYDAFKELDINYLRALKDECCTVRSLTKFLNEILGKQNKFRENLDLSISKQEELGMIRYKFFKFRDSGVSFWFSNLDNKGTDANKGADVNICVMGPGKGDKPVSMPFETYVKKRIESGRA